MSPKKTLFFTLLLAVVFLTGCDLSTYFNPKTAKNAGEYDRVARTFLETLHNGDIADIEKAVTPELAKKEARAQLLEVAGLFSKDDIASIETIRSLDMTGYFSDTKHMLLAYQIRLDNSWLKAMVVVDETDGGRKISTLYAEPMEKSMKELYAFNLAGASVSNYIMLLMAIAVPAFIAYMIVNCLRSQVKHKIAWICFMLVGAGTLTYNWTTGHIGFNLLSPLLMGSKISKDTIYGPWIISTSIPIGAVVFLMYWNKLTERELLSNKTGQNSTPE